MALTAEGTISLWNPAAERVFGWTASEVVGGPLPFIPEEKRAEHLLMRERDLAGQGFTGREIRRRRKDGSPIDISVSTAPIRDPDGRVIGIMSVYADITQHKATQEWLQQQAELLEQAHDAMLVWDIDGVIEYWNRAAEELYGYTKAEAVGRVSHQLLCTESTSGESFLAELRRSRRWSAELLHTTRDGRRIIVESRQVVVRTSGGVDVVLESNRDVTGRVRAERELREANEALRRANSDLEQFAFAAAHDLQEPLRNIGIFAQLLTRRHSSELVGDAAEYLNTIRNSAQRMQMLVSDLLAYTSSTNERHPERASANADAVLRRVLQDLARPLKESGGTVTAPVLPALPISEPHLTQLFQNLIGNAIKYSRSGEPPRIDIAIQQEGGESRLSVTDNGQGIEPEYRQRVFGLFKRLHSSDVPGTGLGLAICKRIVEHYGGRIWVEDGPGGVGASFRVALPQRHLDAGSK